MCGRFTLTVDPAQLREALPGFSVPEEIKPRYNIAPSQPVAVVPNDGRNQLDFFVWGLIPSWAKDPSIGNRMINARGETLAEKPSFRAAYRRRRCLVLADGFYEWRKEPGSKAKTPMYVQMESKEPFGLAGLWEIWYSPDGSEIRSCTIITTQPNGLLEKIHNRMPVILPKEAYPLWLAQEEKESSELNALLRPFPAEEMIAYPVSRMVNSPANDVPECIEPVAA
ncbi:MAG: SOS response-associated peptidase [Anaerolineales bacterium]|jgi:putative SOS response-associated peptidase YedK